MLYILMDHINVFKEARLLKIPEQKGLVFNQLMLGKVSVKVMQSWLASSVVTA